MKRIFIPALLVGLLFTSCSGNPEGSEKVILKPQTTKVTGALSHNYEVVSKEYKTSNDGYSSMLAVTIKRISDDLPFVPDETEPYGTSSMGKNTHIGFGIELFDENGNSIETINATSDGLGGVYDSEDIQSIINLQKGETATVRWSIEDDLISKVKSFKITTVLENVKPFESTGNDGSEDIDESPQVSGDMNKLLDSYESYINSYIALAKKMSKNDDSAMQEYPKFMEKTQKLTEELDKNQGNMSDAQMKRFMTLQAKFMKAASSIK